MKARLVWFVGGCFLAIRLFGAEVKPGDDPSDVRAALGDPTGIMGATERAIWMYENGSVRFEGGVVSEVRLKTAEQIARDEAAAAERREYWQQRKQKLAEQRLAQGQDLLARQSTNPTFLSLPATEQLDYWLRFQKWYPQISVAEQITAARELVKEERELILVQQQQRELEALRERVSAAEARAAAAEREARRAQRVPSTYVAPYYYRPPQSRVIIVNPGSTPKVNPGTPCPKRSGVVVSGNGIVVKRSF